MYFIGKEKDTNRVLELENKKNEFMNTLRRAVEKYGIPEKLYIDTGTNIITMADNDVKVSSNVKNGVCKSINRIFKDFQ